MLIEHRESDERAMAIVNTITTQPMRNRVDHHSHAIHGPQTRIRYAEIALHEQKCIRIELVDCNRPNGTGAIQRRQ